MGMGCGKTALMRTVRLDEVEVAIVLMWSDGRLQALDDGSRSVAMSSIAGIAVVFAGQL